MQEYWVNAYQIHFNRFFGKARDKPTRFESYIGVYPIYRIHVRMKPVKPKYEEVGEKIIKDNRIKTPIHEKWLEL